MTYALLLVLALSGQAGAASFRYTKAPIQPVEVENLPLSAFGEVSVAEHTNEVNMMFPYGLIEGHIATVTFTGGGSTTSVNNTFTLQTAAGANSSANLCSIKKLRYIPGVGAHCFQTAVFHSSAAASTQTIGCVSTDWADGYGFGYNGTTFGLFHSSGGFTTWVASGAWNMDKMDGTGPSRATLRPQAGQVYSVNYQYLGYGAIVWGIETTGTQGQVIPVHRLDYAGTQVMPHAQNPSFSLCAKVQNHANTTQLRMTTPSHGAFIEGKKANGFIEHSSSTLQASVGTTPYPILSLRNNLTFRGQPNRVTVHVTLLAYANESTNRTAEFRLVKNAASFTGSDFNAYGGTNHSVVDVDTAATAFTGGEQILPVFAGVQRADYVPLETQEIFVYPGETLTVVGLMDTGSADLKAALRWKEEF